jgi:DNA-binding transcriptional LysR family regulator
VTEVNVELDLRKLRSFLAVAERLHFGRAAESLYITQPALSRQIQQLEQEVGAELFERDSRHVALTPAGEVLAREGARLLAAGEAAILHARRAAIGELQLIVGFMLGMDIDGVLEAFAERHPDVEVQLKRLRWWNHGQAIADGAVDVGFVRLPVPSEGLTLLPLYREPICATLPGDHPLATKSELYLSDLANEPMLRYANATPAWDAFWTADPRPDGTEAERGPQVHDMEEIIEYVRGRRGIAFLPEAVAAAFPGRGVVFVRISDIPKGHVALAWSERASPLYIGSLRQAAQEVFGAD